MLVLGGFQPSLFSEANMKVKVRINTDDALILSLLVAGLTITFFGLYIAGQKVLQWIASALSGLDVNF